MRTVAHIRWQEARALKMARYQLSTLKSNVHGFGLCRFFLSLPEMDLYLMKKYRCLPIYRLPIAILNVLHTL